MPPTHTKKPAAMKEMCAHGGPMHCSEGCYSKGGVTTETSSSNRRHSKGVHESITHGDAGVSTAGGYVGGHGYGNNIDTAKSLHREKLSELRADKHDRRNLAKGGSVEQRVKQHDELQAKRGESYGNETIGVHSPSYSYGRDRGASMAGDLVRGGSYKKAERLEGAKDIHRQTLRELKHDKHDRRNLAEGGDVESLDDPMEHEDHDDMSDIIADELMDAMERKDKRGVKDAIEAMVMECMNKGGM